MTKNKSAYKKLCQKAADIPLFYRYDWYQCLYGDDWDVMIEEQDDEVVAFMPYRVRTKKGFKMLLPEPLVPYQGIWMLYPKDLNHSGKLRLEHKVIANIIKNLPKADNFKQKFFPSFCNWLPFYWGGYNQTTKYTYVLPNISDLDTVFSNFKDKVRNQIRKADDRLSIETSNDVKGFYDLKVKDYENKNIKYPILFDTLKKNIEFTTSNNCGELLVAMDDADNVQAMIYYIWDNSSAYFIHSVSTENSFPGAMSLLVWEAIKRSSTKTKSFNFEGSMIESIESYFRSFGTEQTPYFEISKTDSKVLKLLNY